MESKTERKELIEKIERISIAIWEILLDKPVYDLDVRELPNVVFGVLTRANVSTEDKELAVAVTEELIGEKRKDIDVRDIQALQDILLTAKFRLIGDRRHRFKIVFHGSVVIDALSEGEAVMKFMKMSVEDVKPEIEIVQLRAGR